jgi:dolichyl-phosphate-mannose-protein mannosyltransferase
MRRAFCAVAFLAFALLVVRAAQIGLAGDYVDPVGRITAQDEALYSHSAIAMVTRGDWLTPRFMGRFALYKPPMLLWSAALSARIFGISRLSLRLPSVLLAALAAGLLFLWAAEIAGWQAGAAAVMLLLSNRLWLTLGALAMTDSLLVAFFIAAFYALFCDPWLETRAGLLGFSAAVAAAVLTKGIAGIPLLAVLGLYWLAAPPKYRPRFARVCLAAALSLLFAAPWFAYQAVVHTRWFWTEHFAIEIFGFGAGAPPQTSREPQALFYLARLAVTDPVVLAIAFAALPSWFAELRRRSPGATLLACWVAVSVGSVLAWQYRNASYLLPLVPALALLAAAYSPFTQRRYAPWTLAALAAAFVLKCAVPDLTWGLSFDESTIQPLAAPLSTYCEQRRGNDLIIVDVADDLYATALPLARLRYAAFRHSAVGGRYGLPFEEMGIAVTVDRFNALPTLEPRFRDRLRQWGLDSSDPIATLIELNTGDDLAFLTGNHPEADFLVPASRRSDVALAPHFIAPAGRDYVFLLSRHRLERPPPAWTCHM